MKLVGFALMLSLLAAQARGVALVDVVVSAGSVQVGDHFSVELRGSLSRPVAGWGLDLSLSPSLALQIGAPEIGSRWIATSSADGDGLAGLAFPTGISGSDILLARIEFRALAPGVLVFAATFSPADLTEGFALDPGGFENDVRLGSAALAVVAEPSLASLLAVASILAVWSRRWSGSRIGPLTPSTRGVL